MKKIFTFLFSIIVIAVSAQSITISEDTVRLRNGEIIDYGSFLITNTSANDINIDCTLRPFCKDSNDETSVSICFGPLCFSPFEDETTYGELLMAPVTVINGGAQDTTFKFEPFTRVEFGSAWEVDFFDQDNPTDRTTLVVYVDDCQGLTSTSNTYEKVNVSISPNPASDWLNLTFDQGNTQRVLNIYNTIGQLEDSEIIPSSAFSHRKNISKLRAGNYFIQVISADGVTAVKKLVVR